jgi:hypothetical protein
MPVLFPEQERILAAIEEFQAGRLDALHLAERVASLATHLDPEHQDDDLTAFVAVLSETDKYLIQDSVRGWHESVREQRAREYRDAEARYHSDIAAAALALQRRWAPA